MNAPGCVNDSLHPSFGYHPDVERLDVPLDRTSFSRALVMDCPVRDLVDRVAECRALWNSGIALPEGIYSRSLPDGLRRR